MVELESYEFAATEFHVLWDGNLLEKWEFLSKRWLCTDLFVAVVANTFYYTSHLQGLEIRA